MFMILRITPDTGSEIIIKLPHFFRNPICHIIPGLGPHMNKPVYHALIQSEIQINACFHKPPGKSQVIIEQEITGSDQDHGRRHSVHLRVKDRGYVRLPDLLLELDMARSEGIYKKVLAKYAKPVLLILDEWLLLKPTETEQHDILELLHQRRKRSSTIFCSQYDPAGWYDQLGGNESPLAEAILDRIKHDAYKINIVPADATQYRSMREVYGMDPAKSE